MLVIGAGAAGLAAARTLADEKREVLVIEARDRLGGRVWTNRDWPNAPVDLGASWIHGHLGNPMTDLASRYQVPTVATDFDFVAAYDAEGRSLKLGEVSRALRVYGQMRKGLVELAGDFQKTSQAPVSLEAAIRRWQDAAQVVPADRKLQRFVTHGEIEVEMAADADELQFPGWDHEHEFGGEQRMLPTGYGSILGGLAKGLEIQLRTAVRAIDYGGSRVKVDTSAGPFAARHVIVTVPLGVLQRGAIRFSPALPAEKQRAISRLGMGLLDKVALRFDESFWPKSHILAFLGERSDQWPDVFNLQPVCGQPVLVAFKSGRAARADERRNDGELVAGLMRQLRLAFGERAAEPNAWHVTRWASDPLAGGSYSFLRLGSSIDDHDHLAAPVGGRLFFAGEATHRDHSATVHGAYLSGLREAKRLLELQAS